MSLTITSVLTELSNGHGAGGSGESDSRGRVNDEAIVDAMVSYIRAHLDRPISLDVLSSRFCVGRTKLQRMFMARMGMSVHRYIVRMRMEVAAFMLEHEGTAIRDIALRCGFSGATSFSEAFRNDRGCSPSEYRRQVKMGMS